MSDTCENPGSGKDVYVFLDFNGKLPNDIFQNEVFLRIANLNKKSPLVQVNDSVFKGSYDYSMGTNLFFEEIEDPPPTTNAFEKQTPINLKHTLSEMKIMNLKPVKIPQRKVAIPNQITNFHFNLDWEYNKLLEKFENGTLFIEDIVKHENENASQKQDVEEDEPEEDALNIEAEMKKLENDQPEDNTNKEKELEDIVPIKILEAEYEKLNILARRPVKRVVSPELVAKHDRKLEEAFEYHNIERQILQPSDAFRCEKVTDINENTLSDCVDIDRCVLYGIIPPSSLFPRVLSVDEKEKVLNLENFENLSLAARYHVLKSHVDDLKDYVKNIPRTKEKDEFGRTPLQTLEIYKKLCEAVKKRLQEIKCSLDNTDVT